MAAGSRTGSVIAVAVVSLLGAVLAFLVVWGLTPTQAAPTGAVPTPAATQPQASVTPGSQATPTASVPTPTPTPPVSGRPDPAPSGSQEPSTIFSPPADPAQAGPGAAPSAAEPSPTRAQSAAAQTSQAASGGAAPPPIVPGPTDAAPSSPLVPAIWSAVIACLTGVLAAAALMVGRSRGRRGATPPPGDDNLTGPGPGLDPALQPLLAQRQSLLIERTALLRGLAGLLPRLPTEFAWQAAKLLEAAGARKVEPGSFAPFDPVAHQVIDTVPTDDFRHDDTVAQLLRVGWRDKDQVFVPAHVLVYALPEHRSDNGPR